MDSCLLWTKVCIKKTFHFISEYSWLTTLWWFQVNTKGTQTYIYMYPFSPKLLSLPAATQPWAEFHVLYSRFLLVIHFEYSRVYMSIPNSLTIPFPQASPQQLLSCFSKSVRLLLFCKFICTISFWIPHIRDVCCKWHYFILFNGWIIFHCRCAPRPLYPFLRQWAFRLLPCLGDCKRYCSELGSACILVGRRVIR